MAMPSTRELLELDAQTRLELIDKLWESVVSLGQRGGELVRWVPFQGAIARRQREARRGRPRADGAGGRDRDQDWPAMLRTYLAPPAQAPVVLRRARPRHPSAQQP